MDPELALRNCRKWALELVNLQDGSESGPLVMARMAELGVKMAESFDALDEWICKGGFLPKTWEPKR